jgi:hypothetical protein
MKKSPEVGKDYQYVNGSIQSWLKPGMIGTITGILDPYTAGVGHFDDDQIITVEFKVPEKKAILKGSTVTGYEDIEVTRRVTFGYSSFEENFI